MNGIVTVRPMRARRPARSWTLGLVAALAVAFIVLPLLALLTNLPWSSLSSVMGASGTRDAIATSLISTCISTSLVLIFGVPLAYLLGRRDFPGKPIVTGLIYMPLVLPPIVSGIVLLLVWGQSGSVEQFLAPHGINFAGEISGIILCQLFVSAPFLIVAARSAFERIDLDLEESARTQGADTFQVFWLIALPLSFRAIMAGAALSWMRAFGEFGATVIVAYHPYSFPVYLWVQFGAAGFGPVLPLALLAIILGAVALVLAALLERVGAIAAVSGAILRNERDRSRAQLEA